MKSNLKIFDISEVEFDSNGVKDFYWPVNTKKSSIVFNYLVKELPILINKSQFQSKEVEAIKIFTKWFIVDIVKLLDASIFYEDIKTKKYKALISNKYKYINSFINQTKIECDTFYKQFSTGLPIPLKLKLFLKKIIYNREYFDLSLSFLKKKKIKVTENSRLIKAHAKARDIIIDPISFIQYLPKLHEKELTKKRTDLLKINEILEIIEKSYNKVDCKLYDLTGEYIRDWLNQAVNFIELNRKYFNKKKFSLTNEKEVWFGCGGDNIYNTILIDILRKKNVKVVTHDHGSGNAHHDQTLVHWTEFIHSDLFVQFNPMIAKLRRNALDQKLLFGNNKPKIKDINEISKLKILKTKTKKFNINKKIKKIMYVSTAFHGEGQRMRPVIHDITYYDWQIKLMNNIKKLNVEIQYKGHPESRIKVPYSFYRHFDLSIENKRFEEIAIDTDMFIVDFIFSTTTPKIFKSKKPILFIDPGFPKINKEAINLIKRRCYYIKANYSNEGRIDIDWSQLEKYLTNSSHYFDMTFPDLYFENCD